MENQTRFDLNTALENWRTELAAQPSLSAENQRELETHLRDTFAELKARGLSEEESFWLARRRVGQTHQLAAEFVKADSTQIWRDRVFWMTVALLTYSSWSYLTSVSINAVIMMIGNWHSSHFNEGSNYWFGMNPVVSGLIMAAFRLLPFCYLAFLLLRGRLDKDSRFVSFFRSRRNFAIVFASAIGFNSLWPLGGWWYQSLFESQRQIRYLPINTVVHSTVVHSNPIWPSTLISVLVWPLILMTVALWLLPAEKSPAPRKDL
ncbi:MAG: permease prefix domain 1-containing protein [Verrucomicrobiota bacterium]